MARTIRTPGQKVLCLTLIEARQKAGLTQAMLAEKLKCQQSLIARIESGERRIDVVELIIIGRAIGIPFEDVAKAVENAVPSDQTL
ncbi:helix-turn-helix domain-containing protein [Mameliella alba]|nr:helix-turn-helix domain-containing protein [Antarctobacter heliothermus]MBY6147044.1 helix-turn-helix domain-containing protein [Mameliella alba]MCA0957049.1 helix-turn-helix domain-containing protein [Mameliella alba]